MSNTNFRINDISADVRRVMEGTLSGIEQSSAFVTDFVKGAGAAVATTIFAGSGMFEAFRRDAVKDRLEASNNQSDGNNMDVEPVGLHH